MAGCSVNASVTPWLDRHYAPTSTPDPDLNANPGGLAFMGCANFAVFIKRAVPFKGLPFFLVATVEGAQDGVLGASFNL